ncbi:hypothetical protein Clacol_002405 [Clathrus columnatus]|uniref:Glucose-methanol-choline oxidoreductase N-terminal domain-containing protein n=1 Tax=Clathrus columnatus TaxID=1419009 RepID=A0AAV5A3L3_9AGAM|nr:hypothetical protein Clacol_002405 [Clathrus columnatus]
MGHLQVTYFALFMVPDINAEADYNEWEREGAEGWNYNDLRPSVNSIRGYKKHFTIEEIDTFLNPKDSVQPLPIRIYDRTNTEPLVHGKLEDRIPVDLNTPRGTMGTATWAACIDNDGCRSSAATAYLTDDVLARPNLFVAVNCCVERILFENENSTPRAVGVELRTARNGPLFRVLASREVILSAGAYGTPHLLMVSGIGPEKELVEKKITVIKHLPAVGKNLVDHPTCGFVAYRTKGVPTYDYLNNPLNALFALAQWYMTGKGPMATLVAPGGAFVRSVPMIVLDETVHKPPSGMQGITLGVACLRPKSSGEITLKTDNIWDKPTVDPKWFSDEHDMHVLARGVRLLLKIARTKPLVDFVDYREDKRYPFLWPGTQDPVELTEEQLHDFIRTNSRLAWHPACTARMGKSEGSSVVNAKLKVHGIQSLRIIDVSIFPKQISGHPCAPIIAIAEKAADMIKEAYSVQ